MCQLVPRMRLVKFVELPEDIQYILKNFHKGKSKRIFFGVTNQCSIDVLINIFKKPFDINKTDGGLFYMMEYFDSGYELLKDLCHLTFDKP